MNKIYLILLLFINSFLLFSQTILKDINPGNESSNPQQPIKVGTRTYFRITDNGQKLCQTDGTTAGTVLIPNTDGIFFFDNPTVFKKEFYFSTRSTTYGYEVYKTDTTSNTHQLLKDITTGSGSSTVRYIIAGNNLMYIILGSPQEIWVTDGSSLNTTKLINYTYTGSTQFSIVGDRLFFVNSDATNGAELWTSDGTIVGTQLVTDIRAGSSNSNISNMIATNNQVIFSADNGINGAELWKSEGLNTNTNMIVDFNPTGSIFPSNLFLFDNKVFFNYLSNFYNTDGNSIVNLGNVSNCMAHTIVGNQMYFTGYTTTFGQELWKTNGTPSGTLLVEDIKAGTGSSFGSFYNQATKPLGKLGNNLLFAADNGINGTELMITDGVTTSLLKDITIGTGSSYFGNFQEIPNKIMFASEGINGTRELWTSDGTNVGTRKIIDINPALNIKNTYPLINVSDEFLFVAFHIDSGFEAWKYNTQNNNISLLKDLITTARGTSAFWSQNQPDANSALVLGNKAFFFVDDNENGNELWVSDGTSNGTYLLKDFTPYNLSYYYYGQRINPNYKPGSTLSGWMKYNNEIIMIINNSSIWKINQNLEFTQLYSLPPNQFNAAFNSVKMREFNGKIYFGFGSDNELWSTDGTVAGTSQIVNLNTVSSLSPNLLGTAGGLLYFTGYNMSNFSNKELFRTDGTPSGTMLVKDINIGTGSGMDDSNNFTFLGNKFVFTANDGINGKEIWITDGTDAGTSILKNITTGSSSTNFAFGYSFFNANNKVFFVANDGINGLELWRTDGTTPGTELVKDINTGVNSSSIDYSRMYVLQNNKLLFWANDNIKGLEPWISDGTMAGTFLLNDLNPNSNSSSPNSFISFGGEDFFSASNGTSYFGIWKTDGSIAGTIPLNTDSETQNKIESNPFVYKNSLNWFAYGYYGPHINLNRLRQGNLVRKLPDFSLGSNLPNLYYPAILNERIIFPFSNYSNGNNDTEIYTAPICSDSLLLNTNLSDSKIYKAYEKIEASSAINTTANVQFTTNKTVVLNPGFQTNPNGIFLAKIGSCVNTNNFSINSPTKNLTAKPEKFLSPEIPTLAAFLSENELRAFDEFLNRTETLTEKPWYSLYSYSKIINHETHYFLELFYNNQIINRELVTK